MDEYELKLYRLGKKGETGKPRTRESMIDRRSGRRDLADGVSRCAGRNPAGWRRAVRARTAERDAAQRGTLSFGGQDPSLFAKKEGIRQRKLDPSKKNELFSRIEGKRTALRIEGRRTRPAHAEYRSQLSAASCHLMKSLLNGRVAIMLEGSPTRMLAMNPGVDQVKKTPRKLNEVC